jgi:hypothetical protein
MGTSAKSTGTSEDAARFSWEEKGNRKSFMEMERRGENWGYGTEVP